MPPYNEITEARVVPAENRLDDLFIITIGGVEVLRRERRYYSNTNHAMREAIDSYSRFLSL